MRSNILILLVFSLVSQLSFAEWFFEDGSTSNSFTEMKPGSNSLSVLWWNTRSGDFNSHFFKKYKKNVLDENLIELASLDSAPDVLILGEFYAPHSRSNLVSELKTYYPFSENFPYNADGSPLSVIVFSKYKFSYQYDVDAVNWAPINTSASEAAKYKANWAAQFKYPGAEKQFRRSFQVVRVEKNGKYFSIAPAHISQPWAIIRHQKGKTTAIAELLFGTHNPHYNSVLHFKRALEKYENSISNSEPFMTIGDFNIPTTLFKFTPASFENLVDGLVDIPIRAPYTTFPAFSAPDKGSMPAMNLDHGFKRKNVQADIAISPRLMGSDHYPIWINIR